MKKLITVILSVVMLASLLAAAVSAQSYNAKTHWDLSTMGQIEVKKADPNDVVKDGIIGENEYVKYDVDLNPDSSPLHITFMSGTNFTDATAMLETMEFYFSWDEVHGFNFAIRNTPPVLQQVLGVKDQDPPEDDFCQNTGYVVRSQDPNDTKVTRFYYALGKRTDTGDYLEGHWNQLGLTGAYDPTPGVDYVISYSGNTSLIEWSIPFEHVVENGGPGTVLRYTLSATGGTTQEANWDYPDYYAISLGDMGFGVDGKSRINDAEFLIVNDPIKDDIIIDDPTDTQPGTEPGTTAPGATEPGSTTSPIDTSKVEVVTDKDGNVTYVDPTTGETISEEEAKQISAPVSNNTAPRTGDPMIIIAAVSAIGACGAVVIKRKFF